MTDLQGMLLINQGVDLLVGSLIRTLTRIYLTRFLTHNEYHFEINIVLNTRHIYIQ